MKNAKKYLAVIFSAIFVFCSLTAAFAADPVAETEPNNTAETASAFTFGESATGALENTSDVDMFVFEVAEAGYAKVEFTHAAGGTDSVYYSVSVTDSEQKAVASFSVKGDAATAFSPDFAVSTGKYYITVSAGATVVTSEYTVCAKSVAIDGTPETEPNNDTASANEVKPVTTSAVGTDKHFGILGEGDVDFYSVSVPTGYISLNLKAADNSEGTFKFEIIQKVADEYYTVSETTLPAGSEGWVYGSAVGVKEGVYYVKVSGAAGGYYFEAYSKAGSADEAEYNNTDKFANPVLAGKSLWASMNNAADVDCFTVKTTATDSIKVTLKAGKDAGDETWHVRITDSSGNELHTAVLTSSANVEYSFDKNGEGDFYIYVKSQSGYAGNDYQISAERIDPVKQEENLSLWERIKSMPWKDFWNSNFSFVSMINFMPVLYDLFRTSIGTIIKILSR